MRTIERGLERVFAKSFLTAPAILLVAAIWVGAAEQDESGAPRLWPLDITISLSSSFGEYRNEHIHAGIDIRTGGGEGIPCMAVGDGSIMRMRASPGGYGKALYLKLETGETIVYAHLSEFSPPLEDYLFAEQVAKENYTVDCSIPSTKFRVKEGEVIAYSGSTGASSPHLHFEVRDVRENPVNPLNHGWTIIDEKRPQPRSILWLPLGKHSLVDGSIFPQEIALRSSGAGMYSACDTLSIAGPAGLGIDSIDRSDPGSGKLAPYAIEMAVDGEPAALIERERFSYAQSGEVSLEYEMERVRTEGAHFLLLFEREGETQGNRRFVNGGIINGERAALPEREDPQIVHTALIRILDKNGNESLVRIPFRIAAQAEAERSGMDRRNANDSRADLFSIGSLLRVGEGYSFQGWIASPAESSDGGAPVAEDDPPEGLYAGGIVSIDDAGGRPFRLGKEGSRGMSYVHCLPVRSGEIDTFRLADPAVSLRSRTDSFFSDGFVCLSSSSEDGGKRPAAQQLKPATQAVFFGPWSAVLRSRVDLAFCLDRPPAGREAVYRWNSGIGAWSYYSSQSRGDTVAASIGEPGVYRVFADDTAPEIGRAVLSRRTMYATGASYPEISCSLADAGSGVDDLRTECFLDGHRVIGRYDPFRRKMFILLRQDNILGDHVLEVAARDRIGNESRLQATLTLPVSSRPDSLDGVK